MAEPVFEVRRSRPHAAVQAVFAAFLVALAVGNLANIFVAGEPRAGSVLAAVLFAVLFAFYFWQSVNQYRDRNPQIVVARAGLHVPSALAEPIPWSRVWRVDHSGSLFGRRRIDFDVDPETVKRMRLGQRFLGENIVARKGHGSRGFSIYTTGYDHGPAEITAAIRRFWPPAESDDRD